MFIHRIAVGTAAALVVASSCLSMVQAVSGLKASVQSVRAVPLVRLQLVVRNTTSKLIFVPTCGDRGGIPFLCSLATHLEVFGGKGWKPANAAKDSPLLGGIPITGGIVVKPGDEATFGWEFVTTLFAIPNNAQLRLVLDAWRDETSMKGDKPSDAIPSEDFKIPEARQRE